MIRGITYEKSNKRIPLTHGKTISPNTKIGIGPSHIAIIKMHKLLKAPKLSKKHADYSASDED